MLKHLYFDYSPRRIQFNRNLREELLNQSNHILSRREVVQAQFKRKQLSTGFILSVVSGILISVQGALHIIRTQWALELGLGEFQRRSLHGIDFKVLGIVTLVLGIVVLLGAFLMRYPGRQREAGITVIAFSTLTIMAGGGYLAGAVLGVIGGAIELSHYQTQASAQQPKSENTQAASESKA